MPNKTKEPSSAPAALKLDSKKEQLKTQRRAARPEPKSDPTGTNSHPKDIDTLSDEQLRKLTKANTRKNHGGRSSRLRSQVERVFRRLDNLAADVKLQPRYSIHALPVVSPETPPVVPQKEFTQGTDSREHRTLTTSDCRQHRNNQAAIKSPEAKTSYGAEQNVDPMAFENEEFEIEPATNNSAFADSPNSLGVQPGSARAVRISTSVTVLDYMPSQPASVAQLQRFEHPTRTGKCLQTRKFLAEELMFPQVTQSFDQIRIVEHQVKEHGVERRSSHESKSRSGNIISPPPPRRVRSPPSTPIAYIVPTPAGPYGSRASLN